MKIPVESQYVTKLTRGKATFDRSRNLGWQNYSILLTSRYYIAVSRLFYFSESMVFVLVLGLILLTAKLKT